MDGDRHCTKGKALPGWGQTLTGFSTFTPHSVAIYDVYLLMWIDFFYFFFLSVSLVERMEAEEDFILFQNEEPA